MGQGMSPGTTPGVSRGARNSAGGEDEGDSTSQISSEESKDTELDYDFSKTVPWVGVSIFLNRLIVVLGMSEVFVVFNFLFLKARNIK